MRTFAIALTTLPLSACFLDRDTPPEQRAAQYAVVRAMAVEVEPECVPVFRVTACADTQAVPL